MSTLAMRPKQFTADERCLGGRYMLQQQFQALRRRVLSASTQLDTLRPEGAKIAAAMRRADCCRAAKLRRRPYWRRVLEAALPEETQVDNAVPATFDGIADMAINKGLRYRRNLSERRRRRPPPHFASAAVVPCRSPPKEPIRYLGMRPVGVEVDLDKGPNGATECGALAAAWRRDRSAAVLRRRDNIRRRRDLRRSAAQLLHMQFAAREEGRSLAGEFPEEYPEQPGEDPAPDHSYPLPQPHPPPRPNTSLGHAA
eukprot:Hpha_TRINITY_DN13036_c0_g1::TRINITY_DN13036_c0_g1_i1::g.69133::m.69133